MARAKLQLIVEIVHWVSVSLPLATLDRMCCVRVGSCGSGCTRRGSVRFGRLRSPSAPPGLTARQCSALPRRYCVFLGLFTIALPNGIVCFSDSVFVIRAFCDPLGYIRSCEDLEEGFRVVQL